MQSSRTRQITKHTGRQDGASRTARILTKATSLEKEHWSWDSKALKARTRRRGEAAETEECRAHWRNWTATNTCSRASGGNRSTHRSRQPSGHAVPFALTETCSHDGHEVGDRQEQTYLSLLSIYHWTLPDRCTDRHNFLALCRFFQPLGSQLFSLKVNLNSYAVCTISQAKPIHWLGAKRGKRIAHLKGTRPVGIMKSLEMAH